MNDRYKHAVTEIIPDELFELAWTQLQQFAALLLKPHIQQLPPDQLEKGRSDASVCVAVMHSLNVLRLDSESARCWRRAYRLLANIILRGLQRTKLDSYSASPWMSLLPPLLRISGMAFVNSGRQSELEDTAEALAKALLKASEQMLTGLLQPGRRTHWYHTAPTNWCSSPISSARR